MIELKERLWMSRGRRMLGLILPRTVFDWRIGAILNHTT
jgi:hypothetical protein